MDTTNNQSADNFKRIFSRIGHLTRLLRDSMVNLGLDIAIMDVAEAIPDARARLNYVLCKTSQAAERVLTSVEETRPLQDSLIEQGNELSARWSEWFDAPIELPVARDLVMDTRQFLTQVPDIANRTNTQLTEIMMAQDFQDLTGQVIQRMMTLIETIENELVQALMENMSASPQTEGDSTLKNGPQIYHTKTGVVATQAQVDDLLENLGF